MAWRAATSGDDEAIVRMCLALNAEDPGPRPVPEAHTRSTLAKLRASPERGRALVLELDGAPAGYAFLVAYWSNEIGGEVCVIDELYVEPQHRGRGHATRLFEALASWSGLGPTDIVALALETTPNNERARRLYQRSGFSGGNPSMRRLLPQKNAR